MPLRVVYYRGLELTIMMTTHFRHFAFAFFALILASQFLGGCGEPCTYPDQRPITVRFVNSIVDFPKVTVFVNDSLFKKDFPYEPSSLSYNTTYLNGKPLPSSDSVHFVVTSDPAGKDTLVNSYVRLDAHIQTVYAMGIGKNKLFGEKRTAKLLRLIDDDIPEEKRDTNLWLRFVHAVPDLPGLDIYFKKELSPTDVPYASIQYGESTERFNIRPSDIPGLIITEAGNKNNVIIELPYAFFSSGSKRT